MSNSRFSRFDITATPWSPIVPESSTTSPGRAASLVSTTPGGVTPTPAVEMNTPSALPRSTTLVSPVMTGTFATRDAAPMLSAMRFKSASGKPSSMMKLAER